MPAGTINAVLADGVAPAKPTIPDPVMVEQVRVPTVILGVPVSPAASVALPAVNPAAVPVQLVKTPLVGVPSKGVTKVGLVANTLAPVPVSSVKVERRFADEAFPRNVAIPVASPVMSVTGTRPRKTLEGISRPPARMKLNRHHRSP